MAISELELKKEKIILNKVSELINNNIEELSKEVKANEENLIEFKKLMWQDSNSFDNAEIESVRSITSQEEQRKLEKELYFNRLKAISKKPYFASIAFKDEEGEIFNIYMSLTYLKDKNSNNILYDWRSPICSLFYDYETGPASYKAPQGIIKGELKRKRQYKIENNKLLGVFDNNINIDDEVLQDVLAKDSDGKMKNVVNTIQSEQNRVIRNIEDKNLIVQGIAGSGKTTVALHRIAFLLYKLKRLNSNNILIFSPNNLFTEYISDVLPSLGEHNTLQTTFSDYMSSFITEYDEIEDYTSFVSRYYKYEEEDPDFIEYKQSDRIIEDIDMYIDEYVSKCEFINSFKEGEKNIVDKELINNYLKNKYDRLPLFERIDEIAERLSSNFYKGSDKKKKTFEKLLLDNSNIEKNYKIIFKNFFLSEYCTYEVSEERVNHLLKDKILSYEDALLFTYLKGKLEGFMYESTIKQVVIDEAQDYNRLQYIIINEIFKKADFTILGDINQNINPYYSYETLDDLRDLFKGDTRYIELTKTYRSSPEIIEFTNKILNLKHVNAIRRDNNKPVLVRHSEDLENDLIKDINRLQEEYKSIAIITKDEKEAKKIYNRLRDKIKINLIDYDSKYTKKDLIVIPAYTSKGLEFDSVIIYNNRNNSYRRDERNLLYVACTRCQHELIIYN